MDLADYLPMFLAEATEHLQQLNLAIVRIEEVPDDAETVDQIFRIAHSFKGSSATMGFAGIAALTHHMEDVLELLRQRAGGLPRASVDVLFECLDALSVAVQSIEATGEEALDPTALIARLGSLIRPRAQAFAPEPADPMTPMVLAALAEGRRVVGLRVRLADDVAMPAVRAYMILAALGDHGAVLGSSPTEAWVETFTGTLVEAWLATEHEDDVVVAAVTGIADVQSVELRQADPPADEPDAVVLATPAPAPAPAHAAPRGATVPRAAASVRVDAERLDQLMHTMGELVVHRTHLESLAAQAAVPGIQQAMQDVTRASQALQAMVMRVRMIPVEVVLLRLPRLVRDLSTTLAKQVDLQLVGGDIELDRTVVDALGDPLVHLVRNALDHGLEGEAERVAAGKPALGVLEISARHSGANVLIEVRDDGRGIDPARVAAAAVARGLIGADAVEAIDTQRAVELLFAPGFSTASTTSEISGRGVGMDAVRTMIRELGGEVLMSSEIGVGTRAQIRLPLTLAIMPALVVGIGAAGASYAIPIDRVERILSLNGAQVRSVAGQAMLLLEDGTVPLHDGAEAFGHPGAGEALHAVVVRASDRRVAIGVSGLVGQRELVTRPLPAAAAARDGLVSGGAVLASGEITLIVDCDALAAARGASAIVPARGAGA
jgi:two-component system, chemotaxis family, sensor kinase CheA